MTQRFEGKTALVTGGASGIGRAVALALAAERANVVVCDLRFSAAQTVVDELEDGRGRAVASDVGEADGVKRAVNAAVNEFGALHLAFNNAGVGGPEGLIENMSLNEYRQLINTNLNSVFYGMHFQIPAMLRAGGGAIVNNSSILGLVAEPTAIPYTAAKHGVTGMTKAAAVLYADKGIRVDSVYPGYIQTPMLDDLSAAAKDALVDLHPAGRLGTVEEVAAVVLFLLSEAARFVTGSQYAVDGGYAAR